MTNGEMDEALRTRELPPLPADQLKQIAAAITADLKPVRPLAPAGAYLAGFACIFLAIFVVGCYLVGQQGWHALTSVQKLCVFAPLAASVGLLVCSIVPQMTPAAKYARSTAVASASLFALLLVMMAAIFEPAREATFVRTGLACFILGMKFAIPSAILFAVLLRRGAGLSSVLTGATAGGLSGLVGLAILEVQCPNLNLYHILAWHVSVTLVCVLVGMVLSGVTFRRWTSNN